MQQVRVSTLTNRVKAGWGSYTEDLSLMHGFMSVGASSFLVLSLPYGVPGSLTLQLTYRKGKRQLKQRNKQTKTGTEAQSWDMVAEQ